MIFVFDPFAVTMIIAFNNALAIDRGKRITKDISGGILEVYNEKKDEESEESEEIPTENSEEIVNSVKDKVIKRIKALKVRAAGGTVLLKPKYKDKLDRDGTPYEEVY